MEVLRERGRRGPIATIALWLGHETLDSTNKYLRHRAATAAMGSGRVVIAADFAALKAPECSEQIARASGWVRCEGKGRKGKVHPAQLALLLYGVANQLASGHAKLAVQSVVSQASSLLPAAK